MAKKEFKAESKRLLEMMINSIYTQREIFLRELISTQAMPLIKSITKRWQTMRWCSIKRIISLKSLPTRTAAR